MRRTSALGARFLTLIVFWCMEQLWNHDYGHVLRMQCMQQQAHQCYGEAALKSVENSAVEAVRFEADRRRACRSYRIGEAEGADTTISSGARGEFLFAQKSRGRLFGQASNWGRTFVAIGANVCCSGGCLPHRKRPASNALILEDMDGVSLASSWQLPSTKDARYFRKSTKDARYSRKFTKDARHFQKYINNAQQFRKPIKHAHDCRGFIRIAN